MDRFSQSLVRLSFLFFSLPALAVPCQKDMDFTSWLNGVIAEAQSAGVSNDTIQSALPLMVYDRSIIHDDHSQGVFQETFLKFSDRLISANRLRTAAQLKVKYQDLFSRIESRYGVPADVLLAFWALESNFGSDDGHYPILRAVTTLAYDCRRPAFFRQQLIDALRIIERGDLTPDQMNGDWAGELGGMQFTPSDYYKYAVDFDGDGRRDLINSTDDTLASAANFLKHLGWQAGEPWLQEVRVPANLPWDQADLSIEWPRSQWVKWGVESRSEDLPADNLPASLLLPMGHLGPAFLVYHNFKKAYLGWNDSLIYSTTVAFLATRIGGAPPVSRERGPIDALDGNQLVELQQLLKARGYLSGDVDGKLGAGTRAAVRMAQKALGFPPDGYPTEQLLNALTSAS